MLKLDPIPKVITFDCYGTLVQWHRVVREAAEAVLSGRFRQSDVGHAAALADRIRELAQDRQQRSPYCGYKDMLRSSLDQALVALGYGMADPNGGVHRP